MAAAVIGMVSKLNDGEIIQNIGNALVSSLTVKCVDKIK